MNPDSGASETISVPFPRQRSTSARPLVSEPSQDLHSLSLQDLLDYREGLEQEFRQYRSDMKRMETLLSRGENYLAIVQNRILVVESNQRKKNSVWHLNPAEESSSGEYETSTSTNGDTRRTADDLAEYLGLPAVEADALKVEADDESVSSPFPSSDMVPRVAQPITATLLELAESKVLAHGSPGMETRMKIV